MRDAKEPPVIYLPSSGGHGGSRITPELPTRRRFPFRRYSVQEDGSLVVRVKHTSRDSHPHPYVRPTVRFATTSSRRASPLPDVDSTSTHPTSTSDQNPTVELLKSLIPALVDDPAAFEESISSICAAHGIDRSVVSAVTQGTGRRSSGRSLGRTQTLDRSTPPVVVPSSSKVPAVSLVPFKHERPFSAGQRGATIWYTTQSYSDVLRPPSGIPEVTGNLYIHRNISTSAQRTWLFGREAQWIVVPDDVKVNHPTVVDRVLSIRSDGSPNWVTTSGFTNVQGRKAKITSPYHRGSSV